MNYIRLRLLLVLLFCWTSGNSLSQGNTYNFEYFSQEDGLSNNQVHCSFQDRRGFMWFGTSQGVSRFDGYRFIRFVYNPADSGSLRGNIVRVIFENSDGELFIGTENGGLNLYDRNKEHFSHLFDHFPYHNIDGISVNDIREDEQGRLWLATDKGLYRLKGKDNLVRITPTTGNDESPLSEQFIRVMTFDTSGNLWMGTDAGIFILDTLRNAVGKFVLPDSGSANREIWELLADEDGKIWIGTYSNGIFIINRSKKIEKHLIPDPANNRSRTVRSITRDIKGNYWIGTRGGLYIYNSAEGIIAYYYHDEREARSLSGNSVLDIFHDTRGNTWIGTRTGINYLIHSKQLFTTFRAMPNDNRYLNSSEIWAFHLDKSGKIWIGTEDGGVNIYDPATRKFSYLVHQAANPASLSSNCIKAFTEDSEGNLWIATYQGGLNILNLQTGKITHCRNDPDREGTLSDNRVWGLLRDSRDRIWVTTSSGVDCFDPQNERFDRLKEIPAGTQVNWISEDNSGNLWIGGRENLYVYSPREGSLHAYPEQSRALLQDSKGRIWITTLDKGIVQYTPDKGPLRYFGEKEGLANNQSLSILEDNNHFLWIGTFNGLSCFNPETGFFRTFTGKDGLQNSQFNYGAALKLPSGEFLMGGISGFNIFNPLLIGDNDLVAPIVLTELRIFNRRVDIGNGKHSILTKSITETEEITIPFDKKVITIEFAALNFFKTDKNLYSYYLEGFDGGWTDPSTNRTATYTNLNPGEYTFHVKSVITGVPDSRNDLTLKVKILPPFYKTLLFRLLLFIIIAGLLYALMQFLINREKLKNDLAYERDKAKKLHEFDMLKLRFFTNISHEIRTPLTLILGPLEKLLLKQVPESQVDSLLEIMYRNARQLNSLINQILDFRKLESGSLKLELTDGEMVSFIRGIKSHFDHLAKEKEIEYNFNSMVDLVNCRFDPDKIEKIISNLLSNAFKFTDKGGRIGINLSLFFENEENDSFDQECDSGFIEITVKDSGRGISPSQIDRIFNRFFQSGEKTDIPGTGIGLALVKELVRLHNGKVFVTSKPGQGSKFTVRLPFLEAGLHKQDSSSVKPVNTPSTVSVSQENPEPFHGKIMLIIEDNPDVRLFIHHHFDPFYRILDASDGLQGWDLALQTLPDIILCDILMPRLDGYELLKRIKNDERTSHIPVILLTALASKAHEMEGLTAGADDFITKPFDLTILQTKIENILSIRQSLKARYSGEMVLQPKNILISSPDERFLKKAIEVVENNISDPELDIEKFSAVAGVSRMQLYRKLNALTDMTVKEFIRDIRLKRAAQLLKQNKLNVSEIAYSVGFRDLSHFRKCFRQQFGMSASEFMESGSE